MNFLDFLILNPPEENERQKFYYSRLAIKRNCQVKNVSNKVSLHLSRLGYTGNVHGIREWLSTNPEINRLTKVKEIIDKDGNTTTVKSLRHIVDVDTTGMVKKRVTELSHGGTNVVWELPKPEVINEGLHEKLAEKYKDFKPPKFKAKRGELKPCAAVLNLYDAHLDKISFKSETGEKTTLEGNIQRYNDAFDILLSQVSTFKPELIIYPIGNDLFHTNGMDGKTKRGTDLEYYCNPYEAYERICTTVIGTIYKALQVAPVYIPMVAGNHDQDKVHNLGFWIGKLFGNVEDLELDKSRMQRKYLKYGANLLGFAHGDKEKNKINILPILMAQEKPKLWAKTKFRKFYCGDLHHKFEYKMLNSKDQPGVSIEFLRSIGGGDKYHTDNGWIGIPKSASATIWDKEHGDCASFKINIV